MWYENGGDQRVLFELLGADWELVREGGGGAALQQLTTTERILQRWIYEGGDKGGTQQDEGGFVVLQEARGGDEVGCMGGRR